MMDNRGDMHPLVKDRLMKQRTIFAPGNRIRMNVVPMFLNLLMPWGVFTFCCGLTSFWVAYSQPAFARLVILILLVFWLGTLIFAVRYRRSSPEPTWYSYASLMFGIAIITGCSLGTSNFEHYMRPFYEIQDLKVIHQLATGVERGQNFMDAGVVYFSHGSHFDGMRSWHFKHRTLYCVAPIITNSSGPTTQTYDFWAVGKDCCSLGSSDFRCGAWSNPSARSGIRILSQEDTPFYRLAVQQAETLYGIVAAHPLFFEWAEDPLMEVNHWNAQAFKNFLFLTALALVVSLLTLTLATCKFAWIGRAGSVYETNFVNSDEWMYAGTPQSKFRMYGAI